VQPKANFLSFDVTQRTVVLIRNACKPTGCWSSKLFRVTLGLRLFASLFNLGQVPKNQLIQTDFHIFDVLPQNIVEWIRSSCSWTVSANCLTT